MPEDKLSTRVLFAILLYLLLLLAAFSPLGNRVTLRLPVAPLPETHLTVLWHAESAAAAGGSNPEAAPTAAR